MQRSGRAETANTNASEFIFISEEPPIEGLFRIHPERMMHADICEADKLKGGYSRRQERPRSTRRRCFGKRKVFVQGK